jgi:starch-binding outer membrane protein, SusD/RagB family
MPSWVSVVINRRPLSERGARWLVCLLSLGATSCGDVLKVSRPDIVEPDNLNTPAGLLAYRAGAFGDFAVAYGGDASNLVATNTVVPTQILASGMLTDELKETAQPGNITDMDARRVQNTNGQLLIFYSALHRARQAAEAAADVYRNTPAATAADANVAELTSLAGFIYVFLGENFCSGVPVSRVTPTGEVEYGDPLTMQAILQLGIQRFDTAIARAQKASQTNVAYLAQVGKARALVNLGLFPEAATAVTGVPTNFRYEIKFSTNSPRQYNAVYGQNWVNEQSSVLSKEGTVGLDYLDAYTQGDPRAPLVLDPSGGFDKTTGPHYHELLYQALSAPIPLATGIEARLVEAEAALRANDNATFQSIHNAIRATLNAAAVKPIQADTMSAAQRVDFHFRERALWMWLTGHRMGDMRRLVRQYGRGSETVFPTGAYFKPVYATYGTDTNFPVPFAEGNNPNFTQCIDRNP